MEDRALRHFERLGELRGYDRFLSAIEAEIRRLNAHLPKHRKTLKQLLSEEDPSVISMDGSVLAFKRRDLEEAAKVIPSRFWDKVKFPIILLRRVEMGSGVFTVHGGPYEKRFVKLSLGLDDLPFDLAPFEDDSDVKLYRPQVQELLSRYKTLIAIGFGPVEGEI